MLATSLSFKRISHMFAAVAVTATIAACGGGGGDAPAAGTPAPAPATGGPAPAPATGTPAPAPASGTQAPASELASLQGTWSGLCEIKTSGSGVVVGSRKNTLVFAAAVANGSVEETTTRRYYNSDNCTGIAVGTVIIPVFSFSANGTKTIGTTLVTKVDVGVSTGLPSFTGPNAFLLAGANESCAAVLLGSGINQLTICHRSNTAGTVKAIIALNASGTQLDLGDFEGELDAQGYPNALGPVADRYYKQ